MAASHIKISIVIGLAIFMSSQPANGIDISDIVYNINSALADPLIDFSEIPFKKEYDFIIVGCGASGALLANRLSTIGSFQVLCIEAGEKENSHSEIPFFYAGLMATNYAWKYVSAYQKDICQGFAAEVCNYPLGRAVGGGTAINVMLYNRGNRKDYDKWASLGNYGWSYEEVLPYFMRYENFRKLDLNDTSDLGLDGELDIEYGGFESPLEPYLLKSAKEYGVPEVELSHGETQIGISPINLMLRDGRRLSAARAFLFPILDRPNLHIAKNSFVTKILIDPKSKTAIGVEVLRGNVTYTIKAQLEVIVSAGTVKSAQLLMLSGIGPKKHLKDLNIKVIKDLPVGKHLKDHVSFFGLTFISDNILNVSYSNPFFNYLALGRGPYANPSRISLFSFTNVGGPDVPSDVANVELVFDGPVDANLLKNTPKGLKPEFHKEIYSGIKGKAGLMILPVLLKPKSTGHVELNSTDPFDMPKIYPNYFNVESDLDTLIRGIRLAIKIATGKPLQQFNLKLHKFNVEPCSHLKFNTDNFWKCILKLFPVTFWHPSGTCKMGPKGDRTAVVDPELRVNGVKGLRVVDASIMPVIVSAHTTATCYMIAEKAADMIIGDHGAR